jgi:hypothetical protein
LHQRSSTPAVDMLGLQDLTVGQVSVSKAS